MYLKESTRISRFLSLAYVQLEMGNVTFEDLILAELDGRTGDTATISQHLELSGKALTDATKATEALRHKMVENDFRDLPTLKKLNIRAIGESLAANGLIDMPTWEAVHETMKKGGFFEVLFVFRSSLESIYRKTTFLATKIHALQDAARKGEVNLVMEENRPGNVKEAFAILYATWAKFNQYFMASSILSSELWYAFCGFGSLAGKDKATLAA